MAACRSWSRRSSSGTPAISAAARPYAKKIEGTDIFAGHNERHGVNAPDIVGQHGGPVGRPPSLPGVGKVNDQNRSPSRYGIQTGSLAEGELQFVVHACGRPART